MTQVQNETPIQLTPKAIEMAKMAIKEANGEEGEYLRVSLTGGGCAGFRYGLSFSDSVDEKTDVLYEFDGLKVLADVFTVIQIPGTQIDYEDSLSGAGFRFNNPTAKRTCGCGSSFS